MARGDTTAAKKGAAKKGAATILLAIVAGIAGSSVAVAAFGKGTYTIGPFRVALAVTPASSGTTTLGVQAAGLFKQGTSTATTHKGFLAFTARIVDVDKTALAKTVLTCAPPSCATSALKTEDPRELSQYFAENAQSVATTFGIKVGAIALAGGLALGMVGAMGNWKRALIGALAGIVVLGGLAFLAKATYDTSAFQGSKLSAPASQ